MEEKGIAMKILAIDKNIEVLDILKKEVLKLYPEARFYAFSEVDDLMKEAGKTDFDVAFCNAVIPGMLDMELAERIKEIKPICNIIVIAETSEFAEEAIRIHASGYIRKPVYKDDIKFELEDLRYPVNEFEESKCRLQCYGNFEVFNADGRIVHFKRRKSKEALAYITNQRGALCTTREIAAILFEDAPCNLKQMSYMQKILSGMINDLNNEGASEIIIRHYNGIAIDTAKVVCDYYTNPERRSFNGEEYMAQYSWAEYM